MKGRYNGAYMKSYKILPGAKSLLRIKEISKKAKERLKWLEYYQAHGRNARLTCRHFGLSPDTFYRWKRRYRPLCLKSLEDVSRRPHTFRRSQISPDTIKLTLLLRRKDMNFSKQKLSLILERDYRLVLSPSTIGRVLKDNGLIEESRLVKGAKRRRRTIWHIPRLRVSREQRYQSPGNLLQIDTKRIIILGQTFYQFTAVDCFTKIGYSKIYWQATSANAQDFLTGLLAKLPFKIKNIQTDNGSEFLLEFHKECRQRGITHYFSRPHTPKDNALIERFIQTTEYELWLFDETMIPDLSYLNDKVSEWIGRYNTYRPHQSLDYLTPMGYFLLKTKGGEVYG